MILYSLLLFSFITIVFHKNVFYKNIEAEICEILRKSVLRINPRLVEKDITLCVELYVGLNYP